MNPSDTVDPTGNYKLKSLIAEGTRARVYLGEDTSSKNQVAIKFLREDEFPDNSAALKHIKHESQCLSLSAHPNVLVHLAQAQNAEGKPYLVTEYLNGQSLKTLFEKQPVQDPSFMVNIIMQLTHALEAMHKVGVLHLDLRPDKIIVQTDKKGPNPKIIGFGRAGLLPWAGREQLVEALPKSGLYSLQYISPEQAMDKRCLPASDVYSLACIFYEGLTGQPPFKGENELHLMAQHLSGNLMPPSQVKGDVKLKKYDQPVMQAITKETHMRFVDAPEFREALSNISSSNTGWMARLFNKG